MTLSKGASSRRGQIADVLRLESIHLLMFRNECEKGDESRSALCFWLEQLDRQIVLLLLFSCCVQLCDPMDCSMPSFPVLSLPKFMSIKSVVVSNHLILCLPLLLLPSVFPSIRVFSNDWVLYIRYWSFSISPSNEYSGLISLSIDWFDLLTVQATFESSNTTVWKHQFFSAQSSLWSSSHICIWLLENP